MIYDFLILYSLLHNSISSSFQFQFKREQQYQSYLHDHPEIGAAIELFFENVCNNNAEIKSQKANQVKSCRLSKLIEFFTSPNLESMVTEKLIKNE